MHCYGLPCNAVTTFISIDSTLAIHWKDNEEEPEEEDESVFCENERDIPPYALVFIPIGILCCSTLLAITIDRVCSNIQTH